MSVMKGLTNLFRKGARARRLPGGISATLQKPAPAAAVAGGTALSPAPEPKPTAAAVQQRSDAKGIRVWQTGELLLDTYRVEDVKAGGMGYVYIAEHLGWKVKLAIKSPNELMRANTSFFARVLREAEAWTDLGLHPNIAYCYYVRQVEDVPHIFIEYVDGGTLEEWIERGRCADLKVALDLAIQFCHGMEHAHAHGMIHRDIKPKNILMTRDGTLKVTDFGTARTAGREEAALSGAGAAPATGGGLTTFGTQMGTYDYMAPEQWEDPHGVDARADIYSFGVCLYEMVCGRKPYDPASRIPAAVLAQQEKKTPHDPGRLRPDLPRELATVVKRCCALERNERHTSFEGLRQELAGVYRRRFQAEPPHAEVKLLELKADGLNNRGVSLLDLGKREEAEKAFEEALVADPHHLEATYNRGLLLWRSGRMTDDGLVRQLEEVRTTHAGDWRDEYLLGSVHMERGDAEAAAEVLQEAARQAPAEEEVKRALDAAKNAKSKCRKCLRTFEGHRFGVTSVAISPDGCWGLSGSWDTSLKLWEIETGKCLRTFREYALFEQVTSVAIGPDGRWALSSCSAERNPLRLWDLETGRCLRTFEGHTEAVHSVAISPDGRFALSGSDDTTLRLWEIETGRCIRSFAGHNHIVRSVAINPDGRRALSGSHDHTLRLWELETGRCLRTFQGHTDVVLAVAISPEGRWGLSVGMGDNLRLWELETGKCMRILKAHAFSVSSVAISPDGRWGLSGSIDATLRLWELNTGRCVRTFKGHTGCVDSVAISPDGRWAMSGSSDNTVRLWEPIHCGSAAGYALSIPTSWAFVSESAGEVNEACVRARSSLRRRMAADAAAEIKRARSLPGYERDRALLDLWHEAGTQGRRCALEGGWHLRTLAGHTDAVYSAVISPDGKRGLSASSDRTLRLWELATGVCLRTFEGHSEGSATSAAISPDGRLALSGGLDGRLMLWELETGKCLRTFTPAERTQTFEGHLTAVDSVAITPDGRLGLSGSWDATLRLWELSTGRCLRIFEGHGGGVTAVAISPDGRLGLSGSWDATLRLWELSAGKCLRIFEGHTDCVDSVAISPDGRWAMSGGGDKTLRMWELETGRCLRTIEAVTGSVAISPDGRWGLSGGADHALRAWELETGECVRSFEGHAGGVCHVVISRDGRWVLSGSLDNTARLWELVWDYEFPEPADWDEGARSFLEIFRTLHTPYAGPDTLERKGQPTWTDSDFQQLMTDLSHRGYGWLRPEGVRRELERMTLTGPQA